MISGILTYEMNYASTYQRINKSVVSYLDILVKVTLNQETDFPQLMNERFDESVPGNFG